MSEFSNPLHKITTDEYKASYAARFTTFSERDCEGWNASRSTASFIEGFNYETLGIDVMVSSVMAPEGLIVDFFETYEYTGEFERVNGQDS